MDARILILAWTGLTMVGACASYAGPLPDPYRHSDKPFIGPTPRPIMEQVFWVQLNVAPDTPVEVMAPAGVRLLDRTKPGKGRTHTRLYFRSDRGIEKDAIAVKIAGRKDVSVPLRVLTYRQDIEEKTKAVPGVDPSARKQGRSYYTDEVIALAKENLRKFPELRRGLAGRTRYDRMKDEALFASLPSWSVPRQCYSNWPCPHCGKSIYRAGGFYPWRRSRSRPFKGQCPLCNRFFPTNDFAKNDFTSGDAPDDGWGWDPGSGKRSDFAGWVANYNHLHWQTFGGDLHRMALRYLLLGDEDAAHKVAVLVSRMAYVYPGMDMRWQQVRARYLRRGRLLVDGNHERNSVLVPVCRAYDAIFDHIEKDSRLVEFLQTKDPAVRSPDDVKALIETYLIQVFGWDWIRRELSGGNMGAREEDMAQFAACANMGAMSDRWIEELFTHAYNSGANVGGFDDETLVNTVTREGPCMIAALGYAYGYLVSKSNMAEILSKVTSPRWKARCNLYDVRLYPKFRAEFDAWIDFLVAGQFRPGYGDSGGPGGARFPRGLPPRLRTAYERAYRRWPTDKLARAIHRLGRPRIRPLFEPDVWPQVEAQTRKAGPAPPMQSRVMDGVGFVFLESRAHATALKKRAGIALRYGYGRGHHHQDNLNIEMFAKGLSVAPELGYPCWAHPMGGTSHVAHHNTGMIDRSPQYPGAISRGDLEMFALAPEASFADVSAQPSGFPNRMYRRAVCLADAPGDNVYLVDVLRLAGGTVRTWCFHGPPHDDFRSNLAFGPKARQAVELKGFRGRYANNVVEPQLAASDADVWADWKYQGRDVRMRITLLGGSGRGYVTARCAKTDLPPIRYLFAEEEGADGASEFIALWQPYEGKPFIEKVERLRVEGAGPGEFPPAAVRVTLAGGQEDTFLYSQQPDVPLRCGDIEFQGSFGYWSEAAGTPRALHLVNGSLLRKGGQGVANVSRAFRAKITAADYRENTVTLDRRLPAEADVKGRLLYVRAGPHRTAYHVAEVLPSGDAVRLDLNAMIFRSQVLHVGKNRRHVVCEIPPPFEAARGFKSGYYDGATLMGEDRKAAYRVTRVNNHTIYLDRSVDDADFRDVDADGRGMVSMYDFGPGDQVVMYRSVFKKFP